MAGIQGSGNGHSPKITKIRKKKRSAKIQNSEIFFNVLALGAVQTKMLEKAFPGYKASCGADEMAEYIYNFSLKTNNLSNGEVVIVSNITPKR